MVLDDDEVADADACEQFEEAVAQEDRDEEHIESSEGFSDIRNIEQRWGTEKGA